MQVFVGALVGRRVHAVHRRGKQLWWELEGPGPHPLFHFGMTGSFSVQGVDAPKYKSFSVSGSPSQRRARHESAPVVLFVVSLLLWCGVS